MNELQQEMLKIFLTLDTLCTKNDIPYGLFGGTFLGAVRHEGFIPWDDDMDIVLLRKDFERLDAILKDKNNLPEGYYYQSIETSKKYANSTPKLRSDTLDFYERMPKSQEPNKGPWVDIFIWDNVPDGEAEQRKFFKKIKRIDLIVFVTLFLQYDPNRKGLVNSLKLIIQKINELLHPLYFFIPILLKKRNKLIQSYNNIDTKEVGASSYCYYRDFEEYKTQIVKRSSIQDFAQYKFEGHDVTSYKDYDDLLTIYFGDYMKVPEEHERQTHNIKY